MRKGWKRIHRLVVLPDYQGVGIGVRFINSVSALVASEGHNVNLTTTTPALVGALKRSGDWSLVRKGVIKMSRSFRDSKWNETKHLHGAASDKRPTFSFNFQGVDPQRNSNNLPARRASSWASTDSIVARTSGDRKSVV